MNIFIHGFDLGKCLLNNVNDFYKNYEKSNFNTFIYIIERLFGKNNFKITPYDNCDICLTNDGTPLNEYGSKSNILYIQIVAENVYKFDWHIKKRLEVSKKPNHFFIGSLENSKSSVFLPMWSIYHQLYDKSTLIKDKNFNERFNNGVCSMFNQIYPHREHIINNYKSKKVKGIDKRNILKDYLFNIAVENTKDPFGYYITEKLPDAIQAGCIPIYWGGNLNNTPFNQNRIINITDLSNLPDISKYSKNQLEDMWNLNPFICDFEDYCENLIDKSVKKIKDRL